MPSLSTLMADLRRLKPLVRLTHNPVFSEREMSVRAQLVFRLDNSRRFA